MSKRIYGRYVVGGLFLFVCDRLLKWGAIRFCADRYVFNSYLSCSLTYNRGMSWGFFHSSNSTLFVMVSLAVIAVTIVLFFYARARWYAGYSVVGELLVITGSASNIVDRFIYGGVVDFITLSYHDWVWPSFNGADLMIVVGVFTMLLKQYRK